MGNKTEPVEGKMIIAQQKEDVSSKHTATNGVASAKRKIEQVWQSSEKTQKNKNVFDQIP